MRTAILSKSDRAAKKYKVQAGNKTIHCGATGYDDFTTHKDPQRKARYIARRSKGNWNDPDTAGFGSLDSMEQAIHRRFNCRFETPRV